MIYYIFYKNGSFSADLQPKICPTKNLKMKVSPNSNIWIHNPSHFEII